MEKRFTRRDYAIYEKGNPICMTLRDVDKRLNEMWEENEELKQQYHKLNNKLHSIESILEDLGSKKYIGCDERLQVLNEISKVMWND